MNCLLGLFLSGSPAAPPPLLSPPLAEVKTLFWIQIKDGDLPLFFSSRRPSSFHVIPGRVPASH